MQGEGKGGALSSRGAHLPGRSMPSLNRLHPTSTSSVPARSPSMTSSLSACFTSL